VDRVAGLVRGAAWDGVVSVCAGVQGPALRAARSDAAQAVEGAHRRQHRVPLLLEPGDQGHPVRAPRRSRAPLPVAAAWLLQARGEGEEQRAFRGDNYPPSLRSSCSLGMLLLTRLEVGKMVCCLENTRVRDCHCSLFFGVCSRARKLR
jgi:hypothetical protein